MTEANRDAAQQLYELATQAFASGDREKATRLLNKSLRLFPTEHAKSFLSTIEAMSGGGRARTAAAGAGGGSGGGGAAAAGSAAGAGAGAGAGARTSGMGGGAHGTGRADSGAGRASTDGGAATSAGTGASTESRPHTPEQLAEVRRILRATTYYEVLAVSRTADATEVKKAYRKLALAVHPDRNAAPGSSEAFKKLNSAFECLHNPERRREYDLTGRSDDRPAPSGEARYYQQQQHFRRPFRYEDFDDEDLFSAFFGGAGGPMPGMRFRQQAFHTFGRRPGPAPHQQFTHGNPPGAAAFAGLLQLLPLILLLAAAWFSLRPSAPFSLHRTSAYPDAMRTQVANVPYYVPDKNAVMKATVSERAALEREVIRAYAGALEQECRTARYNAHWSSYQSRTTEPWSCKELERVRTEIAMADTRATMASSASLTGATASSQREQPQQQPVEPAAA